MVVKKQTKTILRKEKVIEVFTDEEGFEVRKEVEKVFEEEVPIEEDVPASPAPSTQQSQSQLSASEKKSTPKSSGQAKLNSWFKK